MPFAEEAGGQPQTLGIWWCCSGWHGSRRACCADGFSEHLPLGHFAARDVRHTAAAGVLTAAGRTAAGRTAAGAARPPSLPPEPGRLNITPNTRPPVLISDRRMLSELLLPTGHLSVSERVVNDCGASLSLQRNAECFEGHLFTCGAAFLVFEVSTF